MVTSQPLDVPVIQSAAVAPPKDTPTSSNHDNNNSPNQGMFHGLPRQAWRQPPPAHVHVHPRVPQGGFRPHDHGGQSCGHSCQQVQLVTIAGPGLTKPGKMGDFFALG